MPEDAPEVEVELIEVRDMSGAPDAEPNPLLPPNMRPPFSLLFRSAPGTALAQGIYKFRNPTVGGFSLFIVPVAAHEGGVFYEAVFN